MSDCILIDREPHQSASGLVVPDFYIFLNGSWQQVVFDNRQQWLDASKKVWDSRHTRQGEWTFPGRKRGSPFQIAWQKCKDGVFRLKVRNPNDTKHHWPLVVYESYIENLPTMSAHGHYGGKTPTYSSPSSNQGQSSPSPTSDGNSGYPLPELPPSKGECKYGSGCRNKYSNIQHGVEYTHGGVRTITTPYTGKCDPSKCPGRGNEYHEFAYQH